MRTWSRFGMGVLASTAIVGCSPTLTVPADVSISCQRESDCPDGLVCLVDLGLCAEATNPCVNEGNDGFRAIADGSACSTAQVTQDGVCIHATCVTSVCGDSFVDVTRGEACDTGEARSDELANACRTTCQPAGCGDGVVDDGEACDDGNTLGGDGCSSDCRRVEACGAVVVDGVEQPAVVDEGETCDDNNDDPNDGCAACQLTAWSPTVEIGPILGNALTASIDPSAVAVEPGGTVLVGVLVGQVTRIYRLDLARQSVAAFAGNGQIAEPVDGELAVNSPLPTPAAQYPAPGVTIYLPPKIAVAKDGTAYLAIGHRVYAVDPAGVIRVFAGSGATCSVGACGDGGAATAASFSIPYGLAVDADGVLYIADRDVYRVRKVLRTGIIVNAVGTGAQCSPATAACGDGGAATSAQLNAPEGLAITDNGDLYIAEYGSYRIRRVAAGIITTAIGTGVSCSPTCPTSGAAATFTLGAPQHVAAIGDDIYFSHSSSYRVFRLSTAANAVSLAAGSGDFCDGPQPCGDGGDPTVASFGSVKGIAVAQDGALLFSSAGRLRSVGGGIIDTVLGSGRARPSPTGLHAWSVPAISYQATFRGLAAAGGRDVITSESNWGALVRINLDTLEMTHVAGAGGSCGGTAACGDGGDAALATIGLVGGIAVTPTGAIYFSDMSAKRVRAITASGTISTVAGTGDYCFAADPCGDGGLATAATFSDSLAGVAVADNGDIYVADSNRYRVRRIDGTTGVISTFAGTGTSCSVQPCGDGGLASAATFSYPSALALAGGTLYVADWLRVRAIDLASGTISTVAGDGTSCSVEPCGDGGAATSAQFKGISGITVTSGGDLMVSDQSLARVRRVLLGGAKTISNVAGSGTPCANPALPCGDGGLATSALLNYPTYLAEASGGELVFRSEGHLRGFVPGGRIDTVAAALGQPLGTFDAASLIEPMAAVARGDTVFVADGRTGRILRATVGTSYLDLVLGYPGGADVTSASSEARYADVLGEASGLALATPGGVPVLYFSDGARHFIGSVTLTDPNDPTTWVAQLVAGIPDTPGSDDGSTASASFDAPRGLAWDASSGKLYVADTGNQIIRVIDGGTVSTLAGRSQWAGFYGEGTLASDALFDTPTALALGAGNGLYVADTGNHRVRRIELGLASPTITTVLGDGSAGASLGAGIGNETSVTSPEALALDARGNLFVAGSGAIRELLAGADGRPTGTDVTLPIYGSRSSSAYPESATYCLSGLVLLDAGATLFATDRCSAMAIDLARTTATIP